MIIRWTGGPDGPQQWDFKPRRLMSVEAEAIERVTGMDYGGEYGEKLMRGNMTARRALLWVLRKRSEPTLRYGDVDLCMEDLEIGYDQDELEAIAAKRSSLTDPQQIEAVDELLATSGYQAGGGEGEDPQAPADAAG